MNRAEPTNGKTEAVFWAAPVLLGLLLIFGGTLGGAGMISSGMIGQNAAPFAAYVPLAAGSLLASFWGVRRASAHRLPMGMLVGVLLLLCLLLLGVTLRDAAFSAPAVGTVAGIVLLASLAGAVPGAAARKKKRRR